MSILATNRKPVSHYRLPGRDPPPSPPPWGTAPYYGRGRDDARLWRFVFLSMLLHALAILLFGAPPGGSREGRAMWGSLDVVIRDSFRDAEPALKIERAIGVAPSKPAPPAAPPGPPAPVPVETAREEAPPPIAIPPMLERLERPLEVPEFKVPKPTEIAPQGEGRIEGVPLQAAPLAPVEAPMPQRQLVEPPRIEAPVPAARPVEAAPIERIVAPRIDRQLAEPPRIEAPLVQPAPPIAAPRMDRMVEPRVERQLAEPPPLEAPIAQPVETPALPTPATRAAPVAKPPAPTPAETLPATEAPAAATRIERVTPSPTPAPREIAPGPDRRTAPVETAPSPFRSTPSAPADAPSSTYDPTQPALDLDALRKRAGDLTRQGTGNRALLPFPMPPVEKPKNKLEQAIENARKPDCRTAYKELGLAAVVPLIANEFGEGSCRW